ncbi:MAG: hypothetical protein H7A46_17390 [Verrucomicrobiales bacterium]|nr:hypothetical protein [Verrucomicrobiales bacterium]
MARRDRSFDYDNPLSEPGRWKRWFVRLGVTAAVVVALYLIASSSFFLRRVVLPRLVGSLNGEVSVGTISWHPFSRLRLTDLQVRLADGETVLAAKEADLRYGLVSLLGGRWILPEVRLVDPEFNLVETSDGRTSLDRLWESDLPRRPFAVQNPEELLIGLLTVENGTFSYENQLADGERTRVAGREIQATLSNFGNERAAALELTGRIGLERARQAGGGGRLILALQSRVEANLGRNLRPSAVKTGIRLGAQEATGDYSSLAGLTGRFDGELADKEIRKCLLSFEKDGQSLGSLDIGGPADFENLNMRLEASLKDLSHEVLDLLGSPFGLAFGQTKLRGDMLFNASNDGQSINIKGSLNGSHLGILTSAGATPVLDLGIELDGRVNLPNQSADIRKFAVTATEGDRELLSIQTPRAINLLWNPAVRASVNDSSVAFRLNALDLARWRPLLGASAPQGVVTIEGVLTNRDDGRRMRAWITNRVEGLAFTAGPYAVSNAAVRLTTRLEFRDYLSLAAEETSLEAAVDGVPLVQGRGGSGSYEFRNQILRLQFDLRGDSSELMKRFPHPLVEARQGDFRLNGHTQFRGESGTAGVSLVLDGFRGRLDRYAFDGEWLRADCSVDWTPEQYAVRNFGISVGPTAGAAGSVFATGQATPSGEASFELSAVNLGPDSLTPFLRPYFGPFALAAGTINVPRAQFRRFPSGRQDLELEFKTDQLVVRDNRAGVDHYPLSSSAVLALSLAGSRLEIATNIIAIPHTLRATNVLTLTGTLDLARTEAEAGQLKIRSAGLDLTDAVAFYRTNQPVTKDTLVASRGAEAGHAAGIGAGFQLPEFGVDLDVRRLCVASMDVTNWLAHATSTNGVMRLDSLSAEIGAGRLRARGQAAGRGSAGDTVLQIAAEHLPVGPVSTALFGAERGRYLGDLSAELEYSAPASADGGVPAPATGRFSLTLTNLVCTVLPTWARRTLGPVATTFKLDEMLRSPLRYVGGQAQLAGDSLALDDWTAIGDLFVLSLSGEARLAPHWGDSSFDLPVGIALREVLAQRLPLTNLKPSSQPGFVQLPPFLSVKGTLFDWSPELRMADSQPSPAADATSSGRSGLPADAPAETADGRL